MTSASDYFNESPIGHCLASVGKGAPKQRTAAVVCGGVSVRVRTSVHACVRDVFAIYDDNILARLIMNIIKIIILYFIQIRHTDDFPSAGIPASHYNVDIFLSFGTFPAIWAKPCFRRDFPKSKQNVI